MMTRHDLDQLLEESAALIQQVRELTERLAVQQDMVIKTVKESRNERDGEQRPPS